MELTIQAAHGSVHVRADDSGLSIDASGQRLATPWSDITGAGLADPPGGRRGVSFDPEIVEVTPLLGRLEEAARRLGATHRLLLIAHGPKRSLYQVSIPDDRPEVAELVGELSARLGPRWLGDAHEWSELKRRLGATTPRWYPLAGALFVVAVALLTLPAILAGAQVRDAIEDLDPSAIEPWMIPVLAIWIAAVGGLLYRVRRIFR